MRDSDITDVGALFVIGVVWAIRAGVIVLGVVIVLQVWTAARIYEDCMHRVGAINGDPCRELKAMVDPTALEQSAAAEERRARKECP